MVSWRFQKLWMLLFPLQLSMAQYYQGGYGMDPYGYMHNYGYYPNNQMGYDSQSGYGYGYSSNTRAAEDSFSDSAMISAMTPLNNVVSSVPAQPEPSLFTALQTSEILQERTAASDAAVEKKKSNCTTDCIAAPNDAETKTKTEQRSQKSTAESQQTLSQSQHSIPPCQCPCTQGWSYGFNPYHLPQNQYPHQYTKSNGVVYYPVAHRTRQPYRTVRQYRPTTTYSIPNSYSKPGYSTAYYDPNYNRAYYRSIRY